MRHVLVMASTGAIGLVAVFAVDLINLFYISRLGEQQIAAAVGFAGVVGFFHTSICIGLMIGITASVARLAQRYLTLTMPSVPLLGLGMAASALLRSVGDARRAMVVTLGAAAVTACLDPLFVFAFGLGLDGVALVSVLSRTVMLALGLHGVWRGHQLLGPVEKTLFASDVRALTAIAGPATIDRVTPVAFGLIYALSGAVGPILSQNLGAGQFERVRAGMRASLWFMLLAVAAAVVHRLQLGARHPGHDSLCLVGCALWAGAGDGWAGRGAGGLWRLGQAHGGPARMTRRPPKPLSCCK